MKFDFLLNCHHYTLQKHLISMILQTKTTKKHKKWPYILDHPYKLLIIGGSGSGKTNALLNLIKEQDNID